MLCLKDRLNEVPPASYEEMSTLSNHSTLWQYVTKPTLAIGQKGEIEILAEETGLSPLPFIRTGLM